MSDSLKIVTQRVMRLEQRNKRLNTYAKRTRLLFYIVSIALLTHVYLEHA
jgi:hypothetical protein